MNLLERRFELGELSEWLRSALTTRGQYAVLRGPMGCGRTSLLLSAAEMARAQGLRVEVMRMDEEVSDTLLNLFTARGPDGFPADEARAVDAMVGRLLAASLNTPMLLAVDDIHLCCGKFLRFVQKLIERLPDGRVSVLLAEGGGMAASQDLETLLAACNRTPDLRLTVRPLSHEAVAELVRARSASTPSTEVVADVLDMTGGNPSLVNALLDGTEQGPGSGPGPSLQSAALTATIVRLLRRSASPQMTALIEAVALLDSMSTLERLSLVLRLPPSSVKDLSWYLTASGILSSSLSFHWRVRDAVLGSADDESLSALRLRVAEVLYTTGAPPSVVSHHLYTSGSAPQPWATAVLCDAAEEAQQQGRHDHATSLLEFAEMWSAECGKRAEVGARLMDLAWWTDALALAGRLDGLLAHAREGRMSGKWLARLARRLAWHGRTDEAAEVFELSLSTPSGRPEDRVEQAISSLWIRHVFPAASPRMRELPFEPGREVTAVSFPWLTSALALPELLGPGKQKQLAKHAEEILQNTLHGGTADLEVMLAATLSLLASEHFDPDAPWYADLAENAARGAGPLLWPATQSLAQGVADWWRGDLRGAAGLLRTALDTLHAERWGALAGLPIGLSALVMMERGRHDAVAPLLAGLPEGPVGTPYGLVRLRARGHHHLATGRQRAAVADFRNCGDLLLQWGVELPGLLPWRLDLSEALLHLGQADEARTHAAEHLRTLDGAVTRTRGIALRLLARTSAPAERAALLDESATVLEANHDKLELARTLTLLAQARRDVGDLHSARQFRQRARRLARGCGAVRVLEELGTPNGSRTEDPPGPASLVAPVAASDGWRVLSPAEGRVARLAVNGYTNREIADSLYVTASTVEQHMTRIYRKLNVRRRVDLVSQLAGSPA